MLNVNQLTEQLRMMPDQALQRMAQMYKNDPYILPMLISEDTARKKLRQAAQVQAMQPQPKVVDQAVAAMGTPPQQAPGIAALPAPNVANMSDGGIAGYAEGGVSDTAEDAFSRGGMFDFTQRSEPVVRMADGGVPGYAGLDESLVRLPDSEDPVRAFLNRMPMSDTGETAAERKARRERERELEAAAEAEQRPLARLLRAIGSGDSKLRKALYPTQEEIMSRQQGRDISAIEAAYRDPRRAALDVPNAPTGTPRVVPPAPAMEQAPRQRPPAAPVAAAPVAAAPAPVSQTTIPTYEAPTPEATAAGIAALSKAPDEATKKAFDELKALYEPERKELEERKGKRKSEALLRAGLAMMSGTSPHAMVNIGKGGIEGLNAYQEAQRYDDQAARALRQAEISMRMAQRQEEAGNRRDAISLFNQAQQMQQTAVSSAQQAQQIKQTGEYQRGSLAVAQQNAATSARKVQAYINALDAPQKERARMMAEYGKIQAKVMDSLKTDANFLTLSPDKQSAYRQKRIQEEIANNPFLSNLLFQQQPAGTKVRDPFAKDDEED